MTDQHDARAMVIVGAGHAGGRAAAALREFGWRGRIVMIGAEPHLPYERPPLSKQVLTGEGDVLQCALRSRDAWEADRIEHKVASVRGIVPGSREVMLADGSRIAYEALLLAAGGHVRKLSIPGAQLDGVMTLRTLDDALCIAPRLVSGARVLIVGGGFIGLEVAASARMRGCEVSVIEGAARLLGRAVPEGIAYSVQRLHERNGVAIHVGVAPVEIARTSQGVLRVLLSDARSIDADIVIVGIGIEPADEPGAGRRSCRESRRHRECATGNVGAGHLRGRRYRDPSKPLHGRAHPSGNLAQRRNPGAHSCPEHARRAGRS